MNDASSQMPMATRRALVLSSALGAGALAVGGPATVAARASEASRERPLAGQVALVTGAARGIGRAVSVRLAREGCSVALLDIADQIASVPYPMAKPRDLAETLRLVEAEGASALALRADVRDAGAMRKAVEEALKRFDRLDIAVPNAGVLTFSPLHQMSEAAWDDVIDVNLTGVARTIQAVLLNRPGIRGGPLV